MILKSLLICLKKKVIMKLALSNRIIVLVLTIVLIISAFDTYLVVTQYLAINEAASTNSSGYDFIVSQDGDFYRARNTLTNQIISGFISGSVAINYALTKGSSVYINNGTYELADDIIVSNKLNIKIAGDNAVINGNDKKIIIRGDNYTCSKYPIVSGLVLNNCTIRIENSFGASIINNLIKNCAVGIEFVNSDTWTEGTKIENCHFINCTEGIAFRTPIGNATGSYASSEITRCFFNLYDNSIGINVENLAELADSKLETVRFWIGEYDNTNQTGIRMAGTMSQSLFNGVVFESFANYPNDLFGIDIIETANAMPIIQGGVTFLGNWSARIHNPHSKWIYGVGSIFDREDYSVSIGLNNQFGEKLTIVPTPLKIMSFKAKIDVQGVFNVNEEVTVRLQFEYIDNTYSKPISHVFINSSSTWLTDDEMLTLFSSQSVIWSVIVDAKSSSSSTNVTVKISGYGTAG